MATITQWIYPILIILASVESCSAYCYGYCWYGSWYIWFAIVMALAICCGALGSYLRRRQIQKTLQNRQHIGVVSVQSNIPQGAVHTSDYTRPQIYPSGGYPHYPPSSDTMMTPPPYQSAVNMPDDKIHPDKNTMAGPPTYSEAVSQGSYVNPALDTTNPTAPPGQQAPYPGAPLGQAPYPAAPLGQAPYPTAPSGQAPYPAAPLGQQAVYPAAPVTPPGGQQAQ